MINGLESSAMSLLRADNGGPASSPRVARPREVTDTDFSQMIGEALGGVTEQLRKAEAVSITGIRGSASTQAVVEEVMAAEQTLHAAIAIRDKIVAAYLEISRMAV
jgi:flagellar hook-basal body complex protein FliE